MLCARRMAPPHRSRCFGRTPTGSGGRSFATLMKAIPELYALGPYAPEERQGPVIWLKCIIERSLPDGSPPPGVVPILYLPNVSRQDLRAGGDCPAHLQPLIELQYRGAVWHQRNGRDWTVDAFLTSEDGVGLDIARDNRTRDAMLRALALLAPEPLAGLRGRRLEADDFDRLAIGDPVRDLLSWMSDNGWHLRGAAIQIAGQPSKIFAGVNSVSILTRTEPKGPPMRCFTAAANGMTSGGAFAMHRAFTQAYRLCCARPARATCSASPTIPAGLDSTKSRRTGFARNSKPPSPCRMPRPATRSTKLDNEHKERRGWVWAQLGESPYAVALEPLGRLAKAAKTTLGGATAEAMAADYAAHGWRCDRAAMEALCRLKQGAENGLVTKVVRALYEPWLDRSARRFQELMSAPGVDPHKLTAAVAAERDACVLFADGLRFDVGAILQERLEAQGLRVRMSHRIAPIPTVTATAKPVASPAHGSCSGKADAEDFAPVITSSNQPAKASRLRDAMARAGVEILDQDQSKMAVSGEGGGWTETGKLDALGHSLEALLVRQIDPEIDSLLDRISGLLNAGWSRVRVVTDHGWLLLPGGLPKVELSPHLVATKWSRCAAVKGGSTPNIPDLPLVLEPRAAHRFAAGHRRLHGEHRIRTRRHQPSGMRHSRTHRGARRGSRDGHDHRDQLARHAMPGGREIQRRRPASRPAPQLETGGVEHRRGCQGIGKRTAKRASLSRTTNTRARLPRLSSPTRRDGCSIPSRQPSEKTHEH